MKILQVVLLLIFTVQLKANEQKLSLMCEVGLDSMEAGKYKSSILIFNKVLNHATAKNIYQEKFYALLNLGVNYFFILDYTLATSYYFEAYKLAVENKNKIDQMKVLSNIGILYIETRQYEKAEKYLIQSIDLAKNIGDKDRMSSYLSNLGMVYIENKNYSKARSMFIRAKDYTKKGSLLFVIMVNMLRIDFEEKNYKHVVSEGRRILLEYEDFTFPRYKEELNVFIIKSYLELKLFDKVQISAHSLLNSSKNSVIRLECFKALTYTYQFKRRYRESLEFKDSIIRISNLIDQKKQEEKTINHLLHFEIYKYDIDLKLENEKRLKLTYLFSFIFSAFILVLILLYYIYKKRMKAYIIYKELKDQLLIQKEKEIDNQFIIMDTLKSEINQIHSVSSKKIDELTSEIEERNKKITEKVLQINKINEDISRIILSLESENKENPSAKIGSIIRQLKILLSDESRWNDYLNNFESLNPKFIKALKQNHPSLSPDDFRFLSYLYLNFDSKDISIALSITPEAVRKRKERIIKKLNLSPQVSVYNYLIMIS